MSYTETQMDRIDKALEKGLITEKEADQQYDAIMAEHNAEVDDLRHNLGYN